MPQKVRAPIVTTPAHHNSLTWYRVITVLQGLLTKGITSQEAGFDIFDVKGIFVRL
jgi:hypothetical protein